MQNKHQFFLLLNLVSQLTVGPNSKLLPIFFRLKAPLIWTTKTVHLQLNHNDTCVNCYQILRASFQLVIGCNGAESHESISNNLQHFQIWTVFPLSESKEGRKEWKYKARALPYLLLSNLANVFLREQVILTAGRYYANRLSFIYRELAHDSTSQAKVISFQRDKTLTMFFAVQSFVPCWGTVDNQGDLTNQKTMSKKKYN